jgi:hypothetical protein
LAEKSRKSRARKSKPKNPAAVELGRRGGQQIAKRGAEYFRKLQAKRKTRRGGRPTA